MAGVLDLYPLVVERRVHYLSLEEVVLQNHVGPGVRGCGSWEEEAEDLHHVAALGLHLLVEVAHSDSLSVDRLMEDELHTALQTPDAHLMGQTPAERMVESHHKRDQYRLWEVVVVD